MRKNSKQFAGGPRRGQKTLGWFLTEEMLEKTGSPSPPIQTKNNNNNNNGMTTPSGGEKHTEEKHKRRRGGRGRSRKLTESLSTASEASLPMDGDDEKKMDAEQTGTDFYVYDVASDGYYYEQNGAKGWRRRLPAGAQAKPRPPSAEEQAQQAIATALARQAQLAGMPVFNSTAYNRYYDATSDGYFFEMASVDGWRKRAPAPSSLPSLPLSGLVSSASAPSASSAFRPSAQRFSSAAPAFMPATQYQHNQSYGATLARGELPAKCVMESSASSSVSDDLVSFPSSLSRPTSLDLTVPDEEYADASGDASRLFNWNTDKFIEDLVGQFSSSHLESFDTSTPRTPATSQWTRRFSSTVFPPPSNALHSDDDPEDYALTKELENIWKTPTPVQH